MTERDFTFSEFVRKIIDALVAAKIDYMIGGSVAVWSWGEFRTTADLDVVIDLPESQMQALADELFKYEIMVPVDIMRDLIAETRIDLPINAIHGFTGYKAELFPVRSDDLFRAIALTRKRRVRLPDPIGEVYVHSPEDLIIYKLYYYSISRQTKHARDIGSILASGHDLDKDYIAGWAERKGLLNIWREFLTP